MLQYTVYTLLPVESAHNHCIDLIILLLSLQYPKSFLHRCRYYLTFFIKYLGMPDVYEITKSKFCSPHPGPQTQFDIHNVQSLQRYVFSLKMLQRVSDKIIEILHLVSTSQRSSRISIAQAATTDTTVIMAYIARKSISSLFSSVAILAPFTSPNLYIVIHVMYDVSSCRQRGCTIEVLALIQLCIHLSCEVVHKQRIRIFVLPLTVCGI